MSGGVAAGAAATAGVTGTCPEVQALPLCACVHAPHPHRQHSPALLARGLCRLILVPAIGANGAPRLAAAWLHGAGLALFTSGLLPAAGPFGVRARPALNTKVFL